MIDRSERLLANLRIELLIVRSRRHRAQDSRTWWTKSLDTVDTVNWEFHKYVYIYHLRSNNGDEFRSKLILFTI